MISLKDHPFAGVLWRDFLSLDQFELCERLANIWRFLNSLYYSLTFWADQVRRLLLPRKDGCTLAGRTTKKQCCYEYGPEILTALKAGKLKKRGKTSPRKWKINSVPRKQQTSTRRWSTLSIDTSRPKTGTASSLKEMEGNQLIMMKLTKFWAVGTSLPFKMSDKRTTGWSLMILWDLASYKLINDRRETIKAFQIRCIKYYPEQDPTSQPNCPPKQRNLIIPCSQKKS